MSGAYVAMPWAERALRDRWPQAYGPHQETPALDYVAERFEQLGPILVGHRIDGWEEPLWVASRYVRGMSR